MTDMELQNQTDATPLLESCLHKLSIGPIAAQIALEGVLSLGISLDRGWMPRGSVSQVAQSRMSEQQEDRFIQHLEVLSGEPLHYLIAVLGEWGGEKSAQAIYRRYQNESDIETKGLCLQGLGSLGGPFAVTGLMLAMIRENDELAKGAAWQLHQLGTGGSMDETDAQTFVDRNFIGQVSASCLGIELKGLVDSSQVEGIKRAYLQLSKFSGETSNDIDDRTLWEWFHRSL